MMHRRQFCGVAAAMTGLPGLFAAIQAQAAAAGGIQWFTELKAGLAEAARTGRPILFLSAAPSCGGVSGIW